jgi:hypothetical protein
MGRTDLPPSVGTQSVHLLMRAPAEAATAEQEVHNHRLLYDAAEQQRTASSAGTRQTYVCVCMNQNCTALNKESS